MELNTDKKEKYVGIADCHGIEYFLPQSSDAPIKQHLPIRALSNAHRHAVFFEVELQENEVEQVQRKMQVKDFPEALRVLKSFKAEVVLTGRQGVEKSWEMIPNKNLDPWA